MTNISFRAFKKNGVFKINEFYDFLNSYKNACSVDFEGEEIDVMIKLNKSNCKRKRISFHNGIFLKEVVIEDLEFKSYIDFANCKFQKSIRLNKISINLTHVYPDSGVIALYFSKCEISSFSVTNSKISHCLNIDHCTVDNLTIDRNIFIYGNISISESIIKKEVRLFENSIEEKESYNPFRLDKVQFHELFSMTKCKVSRVDISNCTFHKSFSMRLCAIYDRGGSAFTIINCNFNYSYIIREKQRSACFSISECELSNLWLTNSTLSSDIAINDCLGVDYFGLTQCKFDHGNLTIKNFSINYDFVIEDVKINKKDNTGILELTKATFNNFKIIRSEFYGITLNECTFNSSVLLNNSLILSDYLIEKSIFENEVDITRNLGNFNLKLLNVLFKKALKISNDFKEKVIDTMRINIYDANFECGIFIKGNEKLESNWSLIDTITINCTNRLKGTIDISNCMINNFNIYGTNSDSIINCNNVIFNSILINQFDNYNVISFRSCTGSNEVTSKFSIIDSTLRNVNLLNFNFKTFRAITILRSSLSDMTLVNIEWFEPSAFVVSKSDLISLKNNLSSIKRDAFRQFKFALEKQGDKINSIKLKAFEINAFHEEISHTKMNFGEKLILWSGKSNNHGLNWWKPILLSVPLLFFIYVMMITCQSAEFSFYPNFEFVIIKQTIGVYSINCVSSTKMILKY